MASRSETFSSRISTLWPALTDDEFSLASSAASSSAQNCSLTSHCSLLPSTNSSNMNDFSTFLASSSAGSGPPTTEYLDEIMHEEVGQEAAGTDSGMLTDAAFLSLTEDQTENYSSSSSVASPCTGGTPISTSSSRSTTRVESNYERKKSRAKINRKDLNSRFQQLMEILHLKEDRKVNRAKILEKAIEHIEKLTEELDSLKGGQQPGQTQVRARKTAVRPQQFHMMPHASSQRVIVGSRGNKPRGVTPLLPFDPSQNHAWITPAGANLPLTPMMWVPCPMMPPSNMTLKRPAPERPPDRTTRKRGRVENAEEGPMTMTASATTAASETTTLTTSLTCTTKDTSLFVWTAQEIPTLLAYCDAWTLVVIMSTSRELNLVAQSGKLWEDLCRARWRIPRVISISSPRDQWQQWHCANRIPDCSEVTSGGFYFASGRSRGVSVWGLLSRRSNGRTTRTVLMKGKATVMQVVELYLVVQNLSSGRVRATDCISVGSSLDSAPSVFCPFTASSGAHLIPQVVAFNTEPCASRDVAAIVLQHGDFCVLNVFLECSGLDLEDQFLQRASLLSIKCELQRNDDIVEHVNCGILWTPTTDWAYLRNAKAHPTMFWENHLMAAAATNTNRIAAAAPPFEIDQKYCSAWQLFSSTPYIETIPLRTDKSPAHASNFTNCQVALH